MQRPLTTSADYDVLPLGVCVVDRDLRVHVWNRKLEQWTGHPRAAMVGGLLSDRFPGVAKPPLASRLRSVFEQNVPLVLSAALHRQFLPARLDSQEVMPQRTRVQPLEVDGGPGAIIVIEDLSQPMAQLDDLRRERRRLEQSEASLRLQSEELQLTNAKLQEASRRAEQANRAKSEFLANMSHEIRTPLTAILGFAEILLEDAGQQANRDAAATIRRNGEHLLSVVNDILDLSKIEAGKFELQRAPCSPMAVAEAVISLMQVRADEKGVDLRLRRHPGTPDVIGSDATKIRQILLNLVGNAIKFTESGSVTLSLSAADLESRDASGSLGERRRVVFAVEDTGVGIPSEALQRIFDPFSQVDASARRRFGGTGLGLAICSRLGSMLGGCITVESSLGFGSCFRLELPVTGAAPQDHGPERPPRPSRPDDTATDARENPLDGRRILVAEDGPDNQRLISFFLRRAGAAVTLVGDGRQAVNRLLDEIAPDEPFDAVLMDMQMPILDGYGATRELRERGYTGPVVALTAHAMDGDREKALAAGCDDYAAKPIDAPRLIAILTDQVSRGEEPTVAASSTAL